MLLNKHFFFLIGISVKNCSLQCSVHISISRSLAVCPWLSGADCLQTRNSAFEISCISCIASHVNYKQLTKLEKLVPNRREGQLNDTDGNSFFLICFHTKDYGFFALFSKILFTVDLYFSHLSGCFQYA